MKMLRAILRAMFTDKNWAGWEVVGYSIGTAFVIKDSKAAIAVAGAWAALFMFTAVIVAINNSKGWK